VLNIKTGIYASLLATAPVSVSCDRDRDNDGIPNCLDHRIHDSNDPEFEDIQAVYRTRHHGKYYYLLISGCCDRYNYVYNAKCKRICAPSGGFTGQGSGDCPDYIPTDLSQYELVWEADK